MTPLSEEEDNYVRMSLLLTGVAPRAVRFKFDKEFAPAVLPSTIRKEYNKLFGLKGKRVINQAQWNVLHPRNCVPDSKNFDITLMICLLRNLIPIIPPTLGYDRLPSSAEISDGADLSRIKFYRNYLAHLDDTKIDNPYFTSAWTDVADAVDRLGNALMVKECQELKCKILDQSNQEIMLEIKHSQDEIKDLKQLFEGLKMSHDCLQEDMKKEVKKHKASHRNLNASFDEKAKEVDLLRAAQNDPVPWNIRGQINKRLEAWKKDDVMFIQTRAAMYVLESIKDVSCVTVTGSSGIGKTFTVRHVALRMAKDGYDVIPVTSPNDIVKFYNPNRKSIFVIDDLCGIYTLDSIHVNEWKIKSQEIENILKDKMAKLIVSCRLQVHQDVLFKTMTLFSSCECNLLSEDMCLLPIEKQSIANKYLKANASEITQFVHLYDCFPLLCKLYHENQKLNVIAFFENPFSVYETEVNKLRTEGAYGKYCALALCVLFNNHLKEELFTEELKTEKQKIFENVCEACKLSKCTSRLVLRDELDSLIGSFIRKEGDFYCFIHHKLFDFLSFYLGKEMTQCLIRNADSKFISERFRFEKDDDSDQFVIILPDKHQHMYIQRIISDWLKKKISDVFSNKIMKKQNFRDKLFKCLSDLDESRQKQLVNLCNVSYDTRDALYKNSKFWRAYYSTTPLFHCCMLGDINLVKWLCDHGVDVNNGNDEGKSPLYIACKNGHTKVLTMLLDNKANINQCALRQKSPLYIACKEGQSEIVSILINNEANVQQSILTGETPLFMACKGGHTKIVAQLLEKNAGVHKRTDSGISPLFVACKGGHTEIVSKLLDSKATVNSGPVRVKSVLYIACERGHTEIVATLLGNKADINKATANGKTPLYIACKEGHTEIVRKLLDNQADVTMLTNDKEAPLFVACKGGFSEIASLLLDKKANINELTSDGKTPLYGACQHGHLEIVRQLLDKNADIFKPSKHDKETALYVACEGGYTEIVTMLLERKADTNKCTSSGKSPLFTACEFGHTGVVTTLLDNNADINMTTWNGEKSLYIACTRGHLEIVRALLNRNADINGLTDEGKTPMFVACEGGYIEVVAILLDKKADINKTTNDGVSPLYIACEAGQTETVTKLLKNNAAVDVSTTYFEKSPLYIACVKGHLEIVSALLDNNADLNKCTNKRRSPLYIACVKGHSEIVSALLENNADINKFTDMGRSPLFIACAMGHTEIVAKLLDKKADINKSTDLEESPLFIACKCDHIDVVTKLLEKNAIVNSFTKKGESPLYIACAENHVDIMDKLLDHKADVNNFVRRSPLHVALKKGHFRIVEKLLGHVASINECTEEGDSPLYIACKQWSYLLSLIEKKKAKEETSDRFLYIECPNDINDDDDASIYDDDYDSYYNDDDDSYYNDYYDDDYDYLFSYVVDEDDEDYNNQNKVDTYDTSMEIGYNRVNSFIEKYQYVAQVFVNKGADFTKSNIEGKTPLDLFKNREIADMIKSWNQ